MNYPYSDYIEKAKEIAKSQGKSLTEDDIKRNYIGNLRIKGIDYTKIYDTKIETFDNCEIITFCLDNDKFMIGMLMRGDGNFVPGMYKFTLKDSPLSELGKYFRSAKTTMMLM